MKKEMELWVIDDDRLRLKLLKDAIEENGLNIKIRQFNVLAEAWHKEGTPDFILIDTTSIMGNPTLNPTLPDYFDIAVSLVYGFTLKHTSANFCIQSAVKRWAGDIIEEIVEEFGGVVIEVVEDTEEVISWLKKYAGNK